jgi:hypothetical protein
VRVELEFPRDAERARSSARDETIESHIALSRPWPVKQTHAPVDERERQRAAALRERRARVEGCLAAT